MLAKINDSLGGRSVIYMIGNFSVSFIGVIIAPILVRLMTTAEYGDAAIYLTWVSLLSYIVGLRADGTLQIARKQFGDYELKRYGSSVLCLGLLTCVCSTLLAIAICTFLFGCAVLDVVVVVLAVFTAFGLACSNFRMAYCSAVRNATGNLAISLALSVSQMVLSIFLLMFISSNGYIARILGYSIPALVLCVCVLTYFLTKGRSVVDGTYWRFCLSLSIPMIFGGIAYLLINQSDRLMIDAFLGSSATGVFSFAYSCALPLTIVTNALNSAWVPEYFDYLNTRNTNAINVHMLRYITNVTIIAASLLLVSPEVLVILGTEEYYVGIPMLPLFVLAFYFQFLYTWPVNYETYKKKTKGIAVATALAALVNITLNCLLIPRLGAQGAALASVLAFAALFVIHEFIARMLVKGFCVPIRWYVGGIGTMIVTTGVSYMLLDCAVARWVCALGFLGVFITRIAKEKALL